MNTFGGMPVMILAHCAIILLIGIYIYIIGVQAKIQGVYHPVICWYAVVRTEYRLEYLESFLVEAPAILASILMRFTGRPQELGLLNAADRRHR